DGMMGIYELRTSALHFQIRAALEGERNRAKAFNSCVTCRDQMEQFMRELNSGQTVARAILKEHPRDESALYFLGKLDLNYVWIALGKVAPQTDYTVISGARA